MKSKEEAHGEKNSKSCLENSEKSLIHLSSAAAAQWIKKLITIPLILITDDNSARWGWSILYSFVGELQVDGDNYDRWGSLPFSFSFYAQKLQNIILGHLRTVNSELCGSYREKISF